MHLLLTLKSLLSHVIKALLIAQASLSIVSLPKIDELYVMLNSSTVYSS